MVDRDKLLQALLFCKSAIDPEKYAGAILDWQLPGKITVVGTNGLQLHMVELEWHAPPPVVPTLYVDHQNVCLFLGQASPGSIMIDMSMTTGQPVLFDMMGAMCENAGANLENPNLLMWRKVLPPGEPQGIPGFDLAPALMSDSYKAFGRINPKPKTVRVDLFGETNPLRIWHENFSAYVALKTQAPPHNRDKRDPV